MFTFLSEMWRFLRDRKRRWLLPLVVVLLLLAAFAVVTASSALAPFIYTVF